MEAEATDRSPAQTQKPGQWDGTPEGTVKIKKELFAWIKNLLAAKNQPRQRVILRAIRPKRGQGVLSGRIEKRKRC